MARVIGIDLGTSSIKALYLERGRQAEWEAPWTSGADLGQAFQRLLLEIGQTVNLEALDALGLSGQTGTYYLLDRNLSIRHRIPWHQPGREAALDQVLSETSPEKYLALTGMEHPRLASYPLPTIRYLRSICAPQAGDLLLQPKDYLTLLLCGEALSDPGSWRGLADPVHHTYARELLIGSGLDALSLPRLTTVGTVCGSGAHAFGLRAGMPVYVGMNDFYSSLVGMGIAQADEAFDVAGTSEHIGVTRSAPVRTHMVCSPYQNRFVHYGVTSGSGVSLAWARGLFGEKEPAVPGKAPLFLPYLQGERAPVFDEKARGLFMGLSGDCGAETLLYSVYEGVVFSLYQIFQSLGARHSGTLHATGGPSKSRLLNRMKAALFGMTVLTLPLSCGSALGAARLAGGEYDEAPLETPPEDSLRQHLARRFEGYCSLYPAWQGFAGKADTTALFN